MKIKFLTGPKAGQISHAPHSQEIQLLAAAGILEIIPWTSYRERLAEEHSSASGAGCIDPNVKGGIEWGCEDRGTSAFSVVRVVKRSGADTTWFSSPPADAPDSIKRCYAELVAANDPARAEQAEAARDRIKVEQAARDEKEKVGFLRTVFTGK